MRGSSILFAAFCLACPTHGQDRGATASQVTQFEIARHYFVDFGPPFDFYELFIVRSVEKGTSIERVTLTPPGDACLSPARFETATGSLTDSIPALLGKADLCKIPEKELRRELKRRKKGLVFSGANVTMQVQCGNQPRLIRSDILDRDMFDPAAHTPEHTSWTMQLLASLDKAVGPGVMDKPMFETPKAEEAQEKLSDPVLLKDLEAGKYDTLFLGAPDKPSDLYRASQKHPPLPTVKLLSSSPIKPTVFPQMGYPAIGKMAHVEGTVAVRIDVDTNGTATNLVLENGNPLLRGVLQDSISQWKFPNNVVSQQVEVTIQFALNCPRNADQKSPTN